MVKIILLGVAQDAGMPSLWCDCMNCKERRTLLLSGTTDSDGNSVTPEYATSLAIICEETSKFWIIDASPDLRSQLEYVRRLYPSVKFSGIFLTHAHMGHYTGLMFLGRESVNSQKLPVYCTPKMKEFLSHNAPWKQLVELQNIVFPPFDFAPITLTESVLVFPWLVPHRAEFTDTVAFSVASVYASERPNISKYLVSPVSFQPTDRPSFIEKWLFFCPDIDRWDEWEYGIKAVADSHHHVLLDATFYDSSELPNRDLSEIPHPFVITSIKELTDTTSEVVFLHLNHSNPLWRRDSPQWEAVEVSGMSVGYRGWERTL